MSPLLRHVLRLEKDMGRGNAGRVHTDERVIERCEDTGNAEDKLAW